MFRLHSLSPHGGGGGGATAISAGSLGVGHREVDRQGFDAAPLGTPPARRDDSDLSAETRSLASEHQTAPWDDALAAESQAARGSNDFTAAEPPPPWPPRESAPGEAQAAAFEADRLTMSAPLLEVVAFEAGRPSTRVASPTRRAGQRHFFHLGSELKWLEPRRPQ